MVKVVEAKLGRPVQLLKDIVSQRVFDAEWSSASTARNALLSRLAFEDAPGGS